MKAILRTLLAALVLCLAGCREPPLREAPLKAATLADGARIAYKTLGTGGGEPIVFIHGFGCDMNAWTHQAAHFSKERKAIFIDLPGYGRSDKPQTAYTLPYFAAAVKAVLDREKAGRVILVGHSLGTPVCRQFVYDFPGRAARLVDVDGVYCFYPADAATTAAYKEFAGSFRSEGLRETIAGFVESLCTPQTPAAVKEYALSAMPDTPGFVAASTMENLIDEKYWTNGVIAVPTLVLASVNSQIPPDYREIMQGLYPDLRYGELSGIGHFIMMEEPEMFNARLDDFLANPAKK